MVSSAWFFSSNCLSSRPTSSFSEICVSRPFTFSVFSTLSSSTVFWHVPLCMVSTGGEFTPVFFAAGSARRVASLFLCPFKNSSYGSGTYGSAGFSLKEPPSSAGATGFMSASRERKDTFSTLLACFSDSFTHTSSDHRSGTWSVTLLTAVSYNRINASTK